MGSATVATVGTSILGSRNSVGSELVARGLSPTSILEGTEGPQEVLDRALELLGADAIPALSNVAGSETADHVSAEISAFVAADAIPAPDDPVVLVASDSDEGMLAALMLALCFRRPVRVMTDEGVDGPLTGLGVELTHPLTLDGAGPVVVARIESLDPSRKDPFDAALGRLAALLDAVARHVEVGDDHLDVNLNGGYKSAIPLVMLLTQFVARRLDDHGATVRAFLKHESGAAAVDATLPPGLVSSNTSRALRTLRDHAWRFDANRLRCETLSGLAWDRDGDDVVATPVGRALACVLHGNTT